MKTGKFTAQSLCKFSLVWDDANHPSACPSVPAVPPNLNYLLGVMLSYVVRVSVVRYLK